MRMFVQKESTFITKLVIILQIKGANKSLFTLSYLLYNVMTLGECPNLYDIVWFGFGQCLDCICFKSINILSYHHE